ncbi:uncharacterized protein STAUR_3079 [Stigmatella aurantiaca DW4/3-1]|uniref:Uncharacterized protein n=1 Tax=Stigmatella aurantiaca (strain DW4/3-1) TaxID=378806 RepID=E3FTR9_STIAD|nr:uncharacterized protein STAUR_3079 [Stigmatella aurantiaca DW4/3-1]
MLTPLGGIPGPRADGVGLAPDVGELIEKELVLREQRRHVLRGGWDGGAQQRQQEGMPPRWHAEEGRGELVVAEGVEQDGALAHLRLGGLVEHLLHIRGDGPPGDEHVQPRMGQLPDAQALEELHQGRQAVGEVEVAAVLHRQCAGLEGQALKQRRSVRLGLRAEVLHGLQVVGPDAPGDRNGPLDIVETAILDELLLVRHEAGELAVRRRVGPRARGHGDEPDPRPDDDAELPQPAAHRVEQRLAVDGRTAHPLSAAGDHLQLQDVVHLEAMAEGLPPNAPHRQRPAHAQVDEVGQGRRALAQGNGGLQQLDPPDPRVHPGAVAGHLMNGGERGHVDEHPGLDLGLAAGAVALADAARARDLQPVPPREADHLHDVLHRTRDEHGPGRAVEDVAKVVRGLLPGRRVQQQLSVERGQAQRARFVTGGPAAAHRVECRDGRHQRSLEDGPAGKGVARHGGLAFRLQGDRRIIPSSLIFYTNNV